MKLSTFVFFISLAVGLLLSCNKSSNNEIEYQESDSYFGMNIGFYVDFSVESITHTPQTSNAVISDTNYYFLRYLVQDSVRDEFGNLNYIFVVKRKESINNPWEISDVWTANINQKNCELVEENQRIIKLKTPVNYSNDWDANVFNLYDEEIFSYERINESRIINSIPFDSTVTVRQCDERNLIRFCKKEEVYAKHIGLVYKYYKDLEISNFDTLNIRGGTECYFAPLAYGIE